MLFELFVNMYRIDGVTGGGQEIMFFNNKNNNLLAISMSKKSCHDRKIMKNILQNCFIEPHSLQTNRMIYGLWPSIPFGAHDATLLAL